MSRYIPLIRKRTETTENPFWISYADLMTALVILFLVVMSISIVAISSRPIVEKKARDTEIQTILDDLEKRAKSKNLGLHINRTDHTISFGNNAQFDVDSYQLSTQAQEKLRTFVPLMLDVKNTKEGERWLKRIHIEGYTDETGSYLYNVHLSLKRAEMVICALLSGKLPKEREQQIQQLLIIDGASVTSIKESREESRRVEVRVEFRQPGDTSQAGPLPKMPLGYCAITPDDDGKKTPPKKRAVVKPAQKKKATSAKIVKQKKRAKTKTTKQKKRAPTKTAKQKKPAPALSTDGKKN
jgi:outer membrane protein OmpA-like peptidoglycan-associated protein